MVLWSSLGGGECKGRWTKADARTGRSAGLSKESAGEASNLMRRPVQQRNRNATTSACVGWDFLNIENHPAFRKRARGPKCHASVRSERLHHYEDDNPDHQDRRHLIDNTIEFLRPGISICCEILNPTGKKAVDAGKQQHQHQFCL